MRKFRELVRYGLAGTATTLFNLGLFGLLVQLGCHYIPANSISYFAAVLINYELNRKVVFHMQKGEARAERSRFLKFLAVRTGFLAADNLFFYLLVTLLGLPLFASRIGLTAASVLMTYFLSKKKIFVQEDLLASGGESS